MKLSTKGRYGLRALVDLAAHEDQGPVSLASIAGRQDISEKYLEQLMRKLKQGGLVQSVKGVQGGYLLAKEPKDISVGEILRVLEGEIKPVDCSGFSPSTDCTHAGGCTTKYVWKRINDSVLNTIDHIFLEELLHPREEEKK